MSSFDIREDFDHAAFARQADRYPALAALVGREFSEASSALKLDAITAYLPKRLERNDGLPSSALDLDEEAVALFAGLPPRGWPSLRSRLGRTDRAGYGAALSELRLALAFTRWGWQIEAFEPPLSTGRRADMDLLSRAVALAMLGQLEEARVILAEAGLISPLRTSAARRGVTCVSSDTNDWTAPR